MTKAPGEFITQQYRTGNPINIEGFGYKAEIRLDPENPLMNRNDELVVTNSESRISYKINVDVTGDSTFLGQIFRKLLSTIESNGTAYARNLSDIQLKQEQLKDIDLDAKFKDEDKLQELIKKQNEITKEFEKTEVEQTEQKSNEKVENVEVEQTEDLQDEAREPGFKYDSEIEHITVTENQKLYEDWKDKGKDLFSYTHSEGEFALIERQFSEKQGISFVGGGKIEKAADIAYLFKRLETASVENAFAVYKGKDGTTTLQYLSTGSENRTLIPISSIMQGAINANAENVTIVHNHPSGSVVPSTQDRAFLADVKESLSRQGISVNDGIIINTKSGKYSTFGSNDGFVEDFRPESTENEKAYKVSSFDTLAFSKDYEPENLRQVIDSRSVARFISSQRLGDRDKMGYIILDNKSQIVGNFFSAQTRLDKDTYKDIAVEMANQAIRFGGNRTILYGRFDYDLRCNLTQEVEKSCGGTVALLDIVVQDKNEQSRNKYISFCNNGYLRESFREKLSKRDEMEPKMPPIKKTEHQQAAEKPEEKKSEKSNIQSFVITPEMLSHVGSSTIPLSITKQSSGKEELQLNMYAMKGQLDPSVHKDLYISKTTLDKIPDMTIYVNGNKVTNKAGVEIGKVVSVDISQRVADVYSGHIKQSVGLSRKGANEGEYNIFLVSTDSIKNIPATQNGNIFLSIKENKEGKLLVLPTKALYSNQLKGVKDFYVNKGSLMELGDKTVTISKDGNLHLDNKIIGHSMEYAPRYIEHPKQNQEENRIKKKGLGI